MSDLDHTCPLGDGGLRAQRRCNERNMLREALTAAGGNVSKAAKRLGIHRTILHRKLKSHGLGRTPRNGGGGLIA